MASLLYYPPLSWGSNKRRKEGGKRVNVIMPVSPQSISMFITIGSYGNMEGQRGGRGGGERKGMLGLATTSSVSEMGGKHRGGRERRGRKKEKGRKKPLLYPL